jgi:hypothetical protein
MPTRINMSHDLIYKLARQLLEAPDCDPKLTWNEAILAAKHAFSATRASYAYEDALKEIKLSTDTIKSKPSVDQKPVQVKSLQELEQKCPNDIDVLTMEPANPDESIQFQIDGRFRQCINKALLFDWWSHRNRGQIVGDCVYDTNGFATKCKPIYVLPTFQGMYYIDKASYVMIREQPFKMWNIVSTGRYITKGKHSIGLDPKMRQAKLAEYQIPLHRAVALDLHRVVAQDSDHAVALDDMLSNSESLT